MDGDVVWTMSVIDNVTQHLDDMSRSEERLTEGTAAANAAMAGLGDELEDTTRDSSEFAAESDRAAQASEGAAKAADAQAEAMRSAKAATDDATSSVMAQNVQWLKNMDQVTKVSSGLRRLTSGMSELGLISEQDEASLQKLNAAVGLVVGTYQLFKGVVGVVNMLRTSEIALAAVETYRSVINSKGAQLALVGVGVGAAAGIVGYLAGQSSGGGGGSSSQTVNQTVTFEGGASSDSRAMGRELLDVMGG
jgi:hypothetical protein